MTLEDANRFENIYGPNISTLKGKTTQSKTNPVVIYYITITKEIMKSNKDITIREDIIFVNKITLFATISRKWKFTTIKCIVNSTLNQLNKSMRTVN